MKRAEDKADWLLLTLPLLVWMLDDFGIHYLSTYSSDYPYYLFYFVSVILLVFLLLKHREGKAKVSVPIWKRLFVASGLILLGTLIGYCGAVLEYQILRPIQDNWFKVLKFNSLLPLPETKELLIFHLLAGSVLVASAKEFFFRHILISKLEKAYSSSMAILLSALLFAAVFWGFGPIVFMNTLFWGFVYGCVYVKWRSTKFAIASEWAQSAFWISTLMIAAEDAGILA